MIIIGIDPGTATTGFAVLETRSPKDLSKNRNEKPKVIDFGCILTNKSEKAENRLKTIYDEVSKLIKKYKPSIIAIESIYFFKNLKTAMPVSQAKGVILLSAAQKNIPVLEFTPLQVKMTVVGYGKAEKSQVQKMTEQLLDLSNFDLKNKDRKKDDASDALGIAICAVLNISSNNRTYVDK